MNCEVRRHRWPLKEPRVLIAVGIRMIPAPFLYDSISKMSCQCMLVEAIILLSFHCQLVV